MNQRKRRRFRALFRLWLLALGAAILLQLLSQDNSPKHPRRGIGFEEILVDALVCALAVYAMAKANDIVFPRLRRAPLYVAAPVGALVYLAVILGSILVTIIAVVSVFTGRPELVWNKVVGYFSNGWEPIVYPFVIAVAVSFLFELSRRIGPAKLLNWILGRYRNPREEIRVFLLIDVRGSTPLAESLGSMQFSFLIRDIFDDLAGPVLDSGGEVVAYVGDEAIISWRWRDGTEGGHAVRCFSLFKAAIAARSAEYQKRYGLVPTFRAAVHAGPVVACEVGQLATQVTFHGDALNTAARVAGECSALEAEMLLTDSVIAGVRASDRVTLEPLGQVSLRGKGEPVGLTRIVIK